jgi:hypothetical protein
MKYLCVVLFGFLLACERDEPARLKPAQFKPLSQEKGKPSINASLNPQGFSGAALLWSKKDTDSPSAEAAQDAAVSIPADKEEEAAANGQGQSLQHDQANMVPPGRPGDFLARPRMSR